MNESTLGQFSLSQKRYSGEKRRIKAVSLFTKPQPLPCCQRAVLQREGHNNGEGVVGHPHASSLAVSLLVV